MDVWVDEFDASVATVSIRCEGACDKQYDLLPMLAASEPGAWMRVQVPLAAMFFPLTPFDKNENK
jgi:hypothetical protein